MATLRHEVLSQSKHMMLFGTGDAMAELRTAIDQVVGTDVSVLIRGETGTGKELVAPALACTGGRGAAGFWRWAGSSVLGAHRCRSRLDRPHPRHEQIGLGCPPPWRSAAPEGESGRPLPIEKRLRTAVVRAVAWWLKQMSTLRNQLVRDTAACIPKLDPVARLGG